MHLYLHIPFCKQACHYCDFHFSTNTSKKSEMVEAICKEIELQKNYLSSLNLETIYFGGGTPSLLSEPEIEQIFSTICNHFQVANEAEITLECNPDDITIPRLQSWKSAGINRLSIGIQSFNNDHLKFLNRVHTSEDSAKCVSDAKKVGFDNLSIDLIYAIPYNSNEIWKLDLAEAMSFDIPHISSYCLTIEEKTVFGRKIKQKKMKPIDEDFAANQFDILLNQMTQNNFEQYEISNFAKNNKYAIHNTSYWQGDEYLGIGPSAHSYNEKSRQWNVSNNAKYIKTIQEGRIPFELEEIGSIEKANEYIMTGLRTKWGINLKKLNSITDGFLGQSDFSKRVDRFEKQGLLASLDSVLTLTNSGKLKADFIASELFFS